MVISPTVHKTESPCWRFVYIIVADVSSYDRCSNGSSISMENEADDHLLGIRSCRRCVSIS